MLGGFVGTVLGLLSGFFGGWTDALIMRLCDVLLAFPGILLALAVVALLGPGIANTIYAVAVFSIPHLMDPRAELIQGKPKPPNMVAELASDHAGAFFLGYHAGAGRHGVLAHTVSGFAFGEIRLNGRPCSEATLNGAYAVRPFTIPGPYTLEIVLNAPALADLAAVVPAAKRLDPLTVGFQAQEIGDVLGWINVLSPLLLALR